MKPSVIHGFVLLSSSPSVYHPAHAAMRTFPVCVISRAPVNAANMAQNAIIGGRRCRGLGDASAAGRCRGAPGQHRGGGCAEAVALGRAGLGRARGAAPGGPARAAGVGAGALPPRAALPAPRSPPLQPGAPVARPSPCLALRQLEKMFCTLLVVLEYLSKMSDICLHDVDGRLVYCRARHPVFLRCASSAGRRLRPAKASYTLAARRRGPLLLPHSSLPRVARLQPAQTTLGFLACGPHQQPTQVPPLYRASGKFMSSHSIDLCVQPPQRMASGWQSCGVSSVGGSLLDVFNHGKAVM